MHWTAFGADQTAPLYSLARGDMELRQGRGPVDLLRAEILNLTECLQHQIKYAFHIN